MDQPTGNLSDRIFIRLHPETTRELAAVAAEDQRDKSEVARLAIKQYLRLRRIERDRREAERAFAELPR